MGISEGRRNKVRPQFVAQASFSAVSRHFPRLAFSSHLRDELRGLREKGAIDASTYRNYYVRAKGGQFRSRAHLRSHMKTEGALSEEVQV